jgi:hypothetical protein
LNRSSERVAGGTVAGCCYCKLNARVCQTKVAVLNHSFDRFSALVWAQFRISTFCCSGNVDLPGVKGGGLTSSDDCVKYILDVNRQNNFEKRYYMVLLYLHYYVCITAFVAALRIQRYSNDSGML